VKDYLIVAGLDRLDGKYEFSLQDLLSVGADEGLSNREVRVIKQFAQVRLGELEEALLAGDNDAYLAVALIVLRRNNKIVNEDALLDAPAGAAISFDFEVMRVEEAEEDGPPAEPAETPEPAAQS
jgi:hypothetical protein